MVSKWLHGDIMALPVRVNEDNYVELERRAKLNRRSIIAELNHILDSIFKRSTVGTADDFRPADLEPVGTPKLETPPAGKIGAWQTSENDQATTAASSASPIKPRATPKQPFKRGIESSTCPHGTSWMTCRVASCNIKGRNMGLV